MSEHLSVRIGIVTILSLIFWQTCAPKKLKLVPAPLVALLVAVAVYSGWRAWGGWPELRRVPMAGSR